PFSDGRRPCYCLLIDPSALLIVKMRAICLFTCIGLLARLAVSFDNADERQLPIGVGDIHAVAYDENVGTYEADQVGLDGNGALAGLFQEHAGEHASRATRCKQILGESESPPRFQNVVDQQYVASAHVAFNVAQD